MAKIRTESYDSKGNGVGRVLSQFIVHKITPSGNFGGGPGLGNILKLMFHHRFGPILMNLKVRFPKLADALYRALTRPH